MIHFPCVVQMFPVLYFNSLCFPCLEKLITKFPISLCPGHPDFGLCSISIFLFPDCLKVKCNPENKNMWNLPSTLHTWKSTVKGFRLSDISAPVLALSWLTFFPPLPISRPQYSVGKLNSKTTKSGRLFGEEADGVSLTLEAFPLSTEI